MAHTTTLNTNLALIDPFNGCYAQTNSAFADASYTEVTGERFVMRNEDVSSGPYFVLEEKPCN